MRRLPEKEFEIVVLETDAYWKNLLRNGQLSTA